MNEETNLKQELPADKVMLAVSKGKQHKLVADAAAVPSGYAIDGVALITPDASLIIALGDMTAPFGEGPADQAENDITIGGGYLDGRERTDWLINWFKLEEGTACFDAKAAGGWLPSVGELALVHTHLEEVNALLKAAGGTVISGQYWTSQLYSADYPWHLDTEKGFRMYHGKPSSLKVRVVASADGYQE